MYIKSVLLSQKIFKPKKEGVKFYFSWNIGEWPKSAHKKMIPDLLENAFTDLSLISHTCTSCVGWVVQILQVLSKSVWLDFDIINII